MISVPLTESDCRDCRYEVRGAPVYETIHIMYCPLHAAAGELVAALKPFAAKDHGHTMSKTREQCEYCHARAAVAKAKGER